MQQWAIDRKPIDRRFQKYNFQTVVNSSFCCKGPWSSINHKVRNRKMLAFTSFSITQLENFTFYVQRLVFYACNNEPSTESLLTVDFKNIIFQTVVNSSFCCKGPWSSINHKVRNRKMLAFTSFSITQLEKLTFYVQRLSFYACNNEPSTESLLTVDFKNIIFRPW